MQNEVQEIEVSLDELKQKITLAEDLDKLHKNPAFKRLILKEYFENKPQQLSKVAAQVTMNESSEKIWQNTQLGIAGLHGFFHGIYREGEQAKADLDAYEAELAEVRA